MSNLPLNINFTQIFLHLLNFLILFAILYFVLYKPVRNFMENREKAYKDMDDEARDNLRASEETKAQYETKISEAESEISQMKQKSRQEIEKNRDSQLQAAKDEAERILKEAKAEATREKERIISEAQAEISEMVTDATEKLALKATAGEAFDQFLDAVDLAEERGSTHEQ
ncbi:MAG: ATP synthase F0 subunit B [Firmicutes bacterium]|nr:ATP synthase F0 subunit B [Bacillota bacterium]